MAADENRRRLERMYAAAPATTWFGTSIKIGKGRAVVTLSTRNEFHHSARAVHGSTYFRTFDGAAFFSVSSVVKRAEGRGRHLGRRARPRRWRGGGAHLPVPRPQRAHPSVAIDLPWVHRELRRTGVTLQQLWGEYRDAAAAGLRAGTPYFYRILSGCP